MKKKKLSQKILFLQNKKMMKQISLLLKVKNPVVNLASPFCYKFM